jgi:hypothetical protein
MVVADLLAVGSFRQRMAEVDIGIKIFFNNTKGIG